MTATGELLETDYDFKRAHFALARAKTSRRYARLNLGFIGASILYNVITATLAAIVRLSWLWHSGISATVAVILLPALFTWISIHRDRTREVERLELVLEERAIAARAATEGRYR